MANIEQELEAFKSARYGEDVRDSMISAITKINNNVIDDTASAKAYADNAKDSLENVKTAEGNVVNINNTLQSVVDSAHEIMTNTSDAEALRVEAEKGRVEAENRREDTEKSYVAQAKDYMEQTKSYATSNYVTEAQSWATGGTNTRVGEDTNNAKYWAEQAASIAGGNAVLSFNGRTGIVTPRSGDYTATQISCGTNSNVSAELTSINDEITTDKNDISIMKKQIESLLTEMSNLKNKCPYEVGDLLLTGNATNPTTRYPGTTWEQITGRFIIGADSTYEVDTTGGSGTVTLKQSDLPNVKLKIINEHKDKKHIVKSANMTVQAKWGDLSDASLNESWALWTGNQFDIIRTESLNGNVTQTSIDNIPPYIAKYIWVRTA